MKNPMSNFALKGTKLSQVNYIYIAQYHKSQFASKGFTISTDRIACKREGGVREKKERERESCTA